MVSELENCISRYFGRVTQGEKELIFSFFQHKIVKKGDFILETGKDCQWMGFIQEGFFRVYAYENGKDVTQWIAYKGFFLNFATCSLSKRTLQKALLAFSKE